MSHVFKKAIEESKKSNRIAELNKEAIDVAILKFEVLIDKLLFEACQLASEARELSSAGFTIDSEINSDLKATDLTGGQAELLEPVKVVLNEAKDIFSRNGFKLMVSLEGANFDKLIGLVEFLD